MPANENWIWQGRQYHMWFGHGTKPAGEAEVGVPTTLDARIRSLAVTVFIGLPVKDRSHPSARFQDARLTQLRVAMCRWMKGRFLRRADFARAMFGLQPQDRGVKEFQDAALSLAEATTHADMRDATDSFALGMEAVGLGYFPRFLAAAAERAELPMPGGLTQVQYRRGSGPIRGPGGGWQELTPGQEILWERYKMAMERLTRLEPNNPYAHSMMSPNAVPSEELVRRLEQEAAAARGRSEAPSNRPPQPGNGLEPLIPQHFPFLGPGADHNVFGGRYEFGVVTAPLPLPILKAPWPLGWTNGAPIPAQVADKLV